MTAKKPPQPLPADEIAIITAWHTKESCLTAAEALGIRASQLEMAWRRLKRDGKLPDRPRYRPDSSADNHDGRKTVDAFGPDPLLAALQKHHKVEPVDN